MAFFLELLKCLLCCEEEHHLDRDYHDYEVVSRNYSPPAFQHVIEAFQHVIAQNTTRISQPSNFKVRPESSSTPCLQHGISQHTWVGRPSSSSPSHFLPVGSQQSRIKKALDQIKTPVSSSSTAVTSSVKIQPEKVSSAPSPPQPTKKPQSPQSQLRPSVTSSVKIQPEKASSVPSPPKPTQKPQVPQPQLRPSVIPSSVSRNNIVCPIPVLHGSDSTKKDPHEGSKSFTQHKSAAPAYTIPDNPKDLVKKDKETKFSKQKSMLPVYAVPENMKDLIKEDKVPEVLRKPLSPLTYADYFAALLYAEDYYYEKWSDYLLPEVTLKIYEESTFNKWKKNSDNNRREKKFYVAFEIDSIPERRPFLLSRDFVLLRPSGKDVKPFKGTLSKVIKSKLVLAEFGDDFHSQHARERKYDVSFSFNRVCLKRSHQAIQAATDSSFQCVLFPKDTARIMHFVPSSVIPSYRNLAQEEMSAIYHILSLRGPPPYLVEGPIALNIKNELSRTGIVIREAILQIYKIYPDSRILMASPRNKTCDMLMRNLKNDIPESEMFRANAAFREHEDVPDDILDLCSYEEGCFTVSSLIDLRKFRVISSTFVTSFRLHNVGINAGHFSHIFLVDASGATEPEAMVTLANLVDDKTAVVVTGSLGYYPDRVRSDIARRCGLKKSYAHRLLQSAPYSGDDSSFVTRLHYSNGNQ